MNNEKIIMVKQIKNFCYQLKTNSNFSNNLLEVISNLSFFEVVFYLEYRSHILSMKEVEGSHKEGIMSNS